MWSFLSQLVATSLGQRSGRDQVLVRNLLRVEGGRQMSLILRLLSS